MTPTPDTYRVVVNDEEQYSIWPEHGPAAPGWRDAGFAGTREACLAYIDTVWTDLRPRSVREHLAAVAGDED
jgi:MbtH protein